MTIGVETSKEEYVTDREKTTTDDKDYSLLPNVVISSSDCTATVEGIEPANSCCKTVSSDSTILCRICQDQDYTENLETLCQCTGSIAKYHVACLEQWLSVSKTDTCELCHGVFKTKRKPRPFTEWLRCLRRNPQGRYVCGDLLCLLILTPLAFTSATLCGEGSVYYVSVGELLVAIGLIALCVLLVLLYILWIILSMRYHYLMWNKWKEENQVVKLVMMPAKTRHQDKRQRKETIV